MSTTLAIVALIFSHRQSVGWAPVAFASKPVMSGTGGSWEFTITVTVEFWNRRRYPVALRFVRADITGVDILDVRSTLEVPRSFAHKNCVYTEPDAVVGPQTSSQVEVAIIFKDQSLDALKPQFDFKIGYFDPRANKEEELQFSFKAFYLEMGWNKTEGERSEFMKTYDRLREDYEARPDKAEEKQALKTLLDDPSLPAPEARAKRSRSQPPKGNNDVRERFRDDLSRDRA
ncbi:hypothetical protein EKN06_00600 [Croceicoccus ponticola]|uniref:Uncharacterized protein n=2 Tax=Croceicoccus ponticola TaxID=2217664 RepID=A0A437GZI0_9SPHN|nr:hypothetical protein EKN06_00600 [Croceicoccus ponticola]